MYEEERTITLDLGSSPDPLIDPILSPPMMPPSHIKKKSQASERLFTAFAPPSPRKQTFELDVGNERSPQRLLVTVEADDDDGTRNTSRRLFQSPTPKQKRLTPRRETTVITTIPLRGMSDDEGAAPSNATPRRRGRPRKSATPATTRPKRPPTPAKGRKTGGRASTSPQKNVPTSDIGLETTPRPTPQSRVAKRKASSPVKEDGAPGSQPRKRGRPRKQTITPDDMARLEEASTAEPATQDNGLPAPPQNQPADDMDDDIWLATLSDQPTPVAPKQQGNEFEIPARDQPTEQEPQLPRHEPEYQQYDWPEMGGGADSHSEAESLASDNHDGFEDTVMAEDFTMIDIGSLLSMQPNSSVMASTHEELGEATSMIIDGALESLRQSQNRPVEELPDNEATAPVEAQPSARTALENEVRQAPEPPHLPPPRSPESWRQSPRRSPRRSPRKDQPLARQLAQKSLQQGNRQSPAPAQPTIDAEPQETSAYEDSFSEIPEAVLVAATPRRHRQPQPQPQAEEPDEDIQPSIERPSRVNHSNPQSETNRLLTPDETPSPIQSDAEDHVSQTKPPRPEPEVELPSSPPIESPMRLSDAMTHHIRRNSTETPADQLSSFTSSLGARDAQPLLPQLPLPDPQPRPTLSPIIRAGRALRLITSDPPSPPGRDSVLGSPFRGSVPKSSQSPTPMFPAAPDAPAAARPTRSPSQPRADTPRADALTQSPSRSWLGPLSQMKDFIVRSLSPARGSAAANADAMDDPFGPDPGESAGSGSVRNTLFSGPSRRSHDRDATVSVASSAGANSVHDGDDAMSWQGEGSPAGGSQRSASPDLGGVGAREISGAGEDWRRSYERPAEQLPARVANTEVPRPREEASRDWRRNHEAPAPQPAFATSAEVPRPQAEVIQQDEAYRGWRRNHEAPAQQPAFATSAEVPRPQAEVTQQEDAYRDWRRGYEAPTQQPALDTSAGTSRTQPEFAQQADETYEEEQEHQQEQEQQEEEEEDLDIWAIEAQRPTPYSKRNAAPRQEPAIEPPRRGELPSTWRQKTQRLTYSGELDQYSDKNAPRQRNTAANEEEEPSMVAQDRVEQVPVRFERNEPRNEDEEFSLLSRSRDKRAAAPVNQPAKKPDLSAFFSSPAMLPEMQEAPGGGLSKTLHARRPPRTMPIQRPQASGTSMFAQHTQPQTETELPLVPQKQLEIGTRPRNVDLFSPVRKSVERADRPAPRSSSPESPEARPAPTLKSLDFTPQQRRDGSSGRAATPVARITSLETPEEEITPPHIVQKMNFTPRQRTTTSTLFEPKPVAPVTTSLFDDNSQISAFFSQPGPHSRRPRVQPREEAYDDEESNFTSAQVNPLPRPASPGKSCIRSPLKPKTPGRVVDFTSSTLSPLTQAQARAERRASMSPEKEDRPQNGRGRGRADIVNSIEADKENHTAPSSPSLSLSPSLSPSPVREQHLPPFTPSARPTTTTTTIQRTPSTSTSTSRNHTQHHPLPTTHWTRTHWLRLDELLQARKRGTLQFQLELSRRPTSTTSTSRAAFGSSPGRSGTGSARARGSCRHLLGKEVFSQGERMILEEWHLDVAEGFLGELAAVGGGGGGGGRGPGGRGAGRASVGAGYVGYAGYVRDEDEEEGEGEGEEEDAGWDGVSIAKRVFALLVGEERRRLGLVPRFREWRGLE